MAIASTTASVVGSISAGNAANAAGKANAAALRTQGKQAVTVANMDANDVREAGRRSAGAIAAQQAANGVALDSASAMDVAAADAQAYEEDALRAIYGGQIRQWGMNREADIKRYEGKVAQTQGYLKAAGTLFGNAASGMFGTFKSAPAVTPGPSGASFTSSVGQPGIMGRITPFESGRY
jgi:hypothetical protein